MGFYSDLMRYLMIKWDIHGILGGSSHFVSELYPSYKWINPTCLTYNWDVTHLLNGMSHQVGG